MDIPDSDGHIRHSDVRRRVSYIGESLMSVAAEGATFTLASADGSWSFSYLLKEEALCITYLAETSLFLLIPQPVANHYRKVSKKITYLL